MPDAPVGNPANWDMQMDYIKLLLWENRERIKAAEHALAEATYVLYEDLEKKLLESIDPKLLIKHKIMLIGGLQLNVDPNDYFEPLFCKLMEVGKTTDLMPDLVKYD